MQLISIVKKLATLLKDSLLQLGINITTGAVASVQMVVVHKIHVFSVQSVIMICVSNVP